MQVEAQDGNYLLKKKKLLWLIKFQLFMECYPNNTTQNTCPK